MEFRFPIFDFGLSSVVAATITFNSFAADVVHQRGGAASLEGRIVTIDDAGVTIQRDFPQPDFIRWDLVRDVVMEHRDPALEKYREDAANLWRARTRLERHDEAMAEPLFEQLFGKYRARTHETALLVAEGLLRCRLARGANESAVIPALETARLRRALPNASKVFSTLPAVLEPRTSLCPWLPPAWVVSPVLTKMEREL